MTGDPWQLAELDVAAYLARVGQPELPPSRPALDGERLLADAGFGMSPLRPIPLADGAEDEHGGWRHRVRRVETGAVDVPLTAAKESRLLEVATRLRATG